MYQRGNKKRAGGAKGLASKPSARLHGEMIRAYGRLETRSFGSCDITRQRARGVAFL